MMLKTKAAPGKLDLFTDWVLRHGPWLALAGLMLAYLYSSRPENVPVIQYRLTLLFFAAILSYYIRRYSIRIRVDRGSQRDIVTAALIVAQGLFFLGTAHLLIGA